MGILKGLAKLKGQSWACRELYLERQRALGSDVPPQHLEWEVGAKVVLTGEASRGYAMALGIPVSDREFRKKGDFQFSTTPGAPSTRLPTYGIVTEISGDLVTADWWFYAGKFAYRRTFSKSALRLS